MGDYEFDEILASLEVDGSASNGHSGVTSDEVAQFALQWDLDDRAVNLLLSVDPDIQTRVMNDFQPTDLSKGASAAIMGFVRSILSSSGRSVRPAGPSANATDEESTGAFMVHWELDAKAQEALTNLDPDTRQRIMNGFTPKDVSRGASIALMGFIKSVVARQQGGAGMSAQAGGASRPVNGGKTGDPGIDQFVAQWGLDAAAQEMLCRLDWNTQQRVMQGFAPKDTSRGASPAFMGFVKSIAGKMGIDLSGGGSWGGAPPARQAFGACGGGKGGDSWGGKGCDYWGGKGGDSWGGKGGDSWGGKGGDSWGGKGKSRSGKGDGWSTASPTGDPVVDEFVENWGLDNQAAESLAHLDPETQARVMNGFSPKDISRGTSHAFMGFMKSVVGRSATPQGFGGGKGGGAPQKGSSPSFEVVYPGGGPAGGTGEHSYDPAIDAFCNYWGLDSKARDALINLDTDVQLRVMSGFTPKDTSRGASVPFMGFLKSVAGAQAQPAQLGLSGGAIKGGGRDDSFGGEMSGDFGSQTGDASVDEFMAYWGLDHKAAEALARLDPEMQRRVMNGFSPKDVSRGASIAFMGFLKSVAGSAAMNQGVLQQQVSPMAGGSTGDAQIDEFVARWGLDNAAAEALVRLDPETQQRVMNGFTPKDTARGASIVFMGFVRSVSNSARSRPY